MESTACSSESERDRFTTAVVPNAVTAVVIETTALLVFFLLVEGISIPGGSPPPMAATAQICRLMRTFRWRTSSPTKLTTTKFYVFQLSFHSSERKSSCTRITHLPFFPLFFMNFRAGSPLMRRRTRCLKLQLAIVRFLS